MAPYLGPRATGPYEKRRDGRATLWIVALHGTDGGRHDVSFTTEVEAQTKLDEFNAAHRREESATVEQALKAYLDHKRGVDGCKESTIDTTTFRVTGLLGPVFDLAIDKLTKRQAEKLYEKRCSSTRQVGEKVVPLSADTQQNELAESRRFLQWAVKKRYIRSNPFGDVERVGKKRKRKPQLHADETLRFIDCAFAAYDNEGRLSALAALCALLLGERTGEIVGMKVRDVDSGGKIVWMAEDDGKTAAARRPVKVPEMLADRLGALAEGRAGSEPLWKAQYHRRWPLRAVKQLCTEAKVPEVTAHGLRGTLTTLALAAGADILDLARLLGHESSAVTKQHYAQPGSASASARERGMTVLAGGKK
jgi:integrase